MGHDKKSCTCAKAYAMVEPMMHFKFAPHRLDRPKIQRFELTASPRKPRSLAERVYGNFASALGQTPVRGPPLMSDKMNEAWRVVGGTLLSQVPQRTYILCE